MRRWSSVGVMAAAVVLLALPWGVREYNIQLANLFLIGALFALSFNVLFGYTGLLSFGQATFFGVGAYALALLMKKAGLSFALAFVLSMPITAIFAGVFGIGAFLAGAAGMLAAPLGSIGAGMDVEIIVAVFAVVIVGGMGSFFGAALASLIIGEVYSFGILVLPAAAQVFMFLVMVIVLVVRPEGLIGAACPLSALKAHLQAGLAGAAP